MIEGGGAKVPVPRAGPASAGRGISACAWPCANSNNARSKPVARCTSRSREEIHESETPRPAGEGEDVFVLRPWGVAQVLALVRRLVGGALVSGEQATRLQAIAARLNKEPALLGGLTRPGEIIAWLGRIAAGRKVDDTSNAREAALAAEEREWFESPAGPMLSMLGVPAIEAILMAGWEADACSRQDWEDAIGRCRREPAGVWGALAATASLAGGKKALSPEMLETLLGLRSPAQLFDALVLGRVLCPVDEGARLVPARATTFAMRLGRAIAQRRGGAKSWCRNADRPHALEILRQAAQAGLRWSDLRTALRGLRDAEPRLEVDACRAAIAFAAYTSDPATITVDGEFVRWWAGAVKAAMVGVHHPDSLWELRFATLGRAHGEPCPLLPWELDLAGLPESVALALPFIFPEDFPSALDAKCSAGVREAVNRWLAAMSDVVGWSRFGEDAEYLAFTRLAPRSVVPIRRRRVGTRTVVAHRAAGRMRHTHSRVVVRGGG